MARSVYVDGRVLTWKRLTQLVDEPEKFSPLIFDKARDLPLLDAQRLYAWLRRRGVDAELRAPGASAQGVHASKRHSPEKGWSV